MLEVENAKVKTKAEADKILQKVEPVRHPLLLALAQALALISRCSQPVNSY